MFCEYFFRKQNILNLQHADIIIQIGFIFPKVGMKDGHDNLVLFKYISCVVDNAKVDHNVIKVQIAVPGRELETINNSQ